MLLKCTRYVRVIMVLVYFIPLCNRHIDVNLSVTWNESIIDLHLIVGNGMSGEPHDE